jgi:hypothetical protein
VTQLLVVRAKRLAPQLTVMQQEIGMRDGDTQQCCVLHIARLFQGLHKVGMAAFRCSAVLAPIAHLHIECRHVCLVWQHISCKALHAVLVCKGSGGRPHLRREGQQHEVSTDGTHFTPHSNPSAA